MEKILRCRSWLDSQLFLSRLCVRVPIPALESSAAIFYPIFACDVAGVVFCIVFHKFVFVLKHVLTFSAFNMCTLLTRQINCWIIVSGIQRRVDIPTLFPIDHSSAIWNFIANLVRWMLFCSVVL